MRICWEELSDNGLERICWDWYYMDSCGELVLDRYAIEKRPTKRHRKWDIVKEFNRLGSQRRLMKSKIMKFEDVEISEETTTLVKNKFVDSVKVRTISR